MTAGVGGAFMWFDGAVLGENSVPCPELELFFPASGWLPVTSKMHVTTRRVDLYCGAAMPPLAWRWLNPLSTITGRTWPIIDNGLGVIPM